MNAVEHPVCQGRAGHDGPAHPERVLHQPMQGRRSRLDEPPRRWYAAVAAHRWGRGGGRRLAARTGLDEQPIRRGPQDGAGSGADVPRKRHRRAGGGRARGEHKTRPS